MKYYSSDRTSGLSGLQPILPTTNPSQLLEILWHLAAFGNQLTSCRKSAEARLSCQGNLEDKELAKRSGDAGRF